MKKLIVLIILTLVVTMFVSGFIYKPQDVVCATGEVIHDGWCVQAPPVCAVDEVMQDGWCIQASIQTMTPTIATTTPFTPAKVSSMHISKIAGFMAHLPKHIHRIR